MQREKGTVFPVLMRKGQAAADVNYHHETLLVGEIYQYTCEASTVTGSLNH